MKNGKNPTRQQKIAIKSVGLSVANWLVYKHDTKLNMLHIMHRETGSKREIPA